MSLADLYKDDRELGSDDSEGSEDDFVPSEAPSDEDEEDGDASGDEQQAVASKKDEVESDELQQQNKRRIDAIWLEMNAPASSPRKAMRTAADVAAADVTAKDNNGQQTTEKTPPPVDDTKSAADATKKNPAGDKPTSRAPPRRKASKISKLVEQAEQRRAKKANTLDAARKSWSGFVAAEGIRDDLEKANKDGYIERQEFLGRVDQRTYQRSKELRK
ncbi:swr complex subunit [Coemansia guatemalensis]|uniref:SWR1-complex protein 5 n=1 Tax=Coemansia guatemalensis TaxID=2761395 RepID=A0A9W8LTN9_9FUNG|nr:swr complex subunit [Coemansia guatemalensis]